MRACGLGDVKDAPLARRAAAAPAGPSLRSPRPQANWLPWDPWLGLAAARSRPPTALGDTHPTRVIPVSPSGEDRDP